MIPSLLPALTLAALLFQDGIQDRVRSEVGTYISPRTTAEDRGRIVDRLVAMGPAAVGYIQRAGDASAPEGGFQPVRFLANEVKIGLLRRVGDERGAQAIRKLRTLNASIQVSNFSLEAALDKLRRQGLTTGLVNPAEQESFSALRFSARSPGEDLGHVLDRLLWGHGLDFYARGSVIVIASRSWLWGPPSTATGGADLQSRVEKAIGQLDADLVDRRTEAEQTIVDAGPGAIPILEKALAGAAPSRRQRLLAFVNRILDRHAPDRLHPPDAELAPASEDARDFARAAREPISISFIRSAPLSEIAARVAEFGETPVAFDPGVAAAVRERRLTLAVDRAPIIEVLEALVVPLGAAVQAEAGRLLIVPRR
ncbi:MAG TPA: hypothetical protein VGK61_06965 [Planctomycetota bacterium]